MRRRWRLWAGLTSPLDPPAESRIKGQAVGYSLEAQMASASLRSKKPLVVGMLIGLACFAVVFVILYVLDRV